MVEPLEIRFWKKVDIRGENECWPWTGGCFRSGYGEIQAGTLNSPKVIRAHRLAFELENGPIPEGMCILHSCDNRLCVNPKHLRMGTIKENNQDMVIRNRIARGFRLPQTKISKEDVAEIRTRASHGETHSRIAEDYPIQRSHVSAIIRKEERI